MGTEATSKDAEMAPQQHTHHTPSLLLRATACRVDEEYENGAGNNNDNKMMGMMGMTMGTTAMMTGTMAMMMGMTGMMTGTTVMMMGMMGMMTGTMVMTMGTMGMTMGITVMAGMQ